MRLFVLFLTLATMLMPPDVESSVKPSTQLQAEPESAVISSPDEGEVIHGAVILRGSTGMDGFLFYEVDFTYTNDFSQSWFLVQESTVPVVEDILAVWDTTTITDGEYDIRLLVSYDDGTKNEVIVKGVRVRNDTPIETTTPGPTPSGFVPVLGGAESTPSQPMTATPTANPMPPSPTSLPKNPAEVSANQLELTLGKGVAITLGVFALLGAYLGAKALQYKRRDR